jgi:hypothetical protein
MRQPLIMLMALATLRCAAHAGDLPFYAALHTRTAPRVDGVLDEPCWQGAEQTRAFVAIGGAAMDVAARALACWDTERLYVALICSEPLMEELERRIARQDIAPFDESIEVFLDPTHDRYTYLQLRVDILGHRDTHRRNDPAPDLNDQWMAATARAADRWTVEMAIPLAMLGPAPGAMTLFGFNANRQRLAHRGPVQYTCWSDTKGGFHSPARFGHLLFGGYALWLHQYFRGRANAMEHKIADLALRFPQVRDLVIAELEQLDQEQARFLQRVAAGALSGEEGCRGLHGEGLALIDRYEQALAETRLAVMRDVLR